MILKWRRISRNRPFRQSCHIILLAVVLACLVTLVLFECFNVGLVISDEWTERVESEMGFIPAAQQEQIVNEQDLYDKQDDNGGYPKRIVIGAVSCRNKSDDTSPDDIINYSEKTVVMLKSVIISAKLYNISTVEIHLFLEHEEDEGLFVGRLAEMGYPNDNGPELLLFTHSAVDTVPIEYRDHMIYHPRYRCGYVRFFFPSALPEVDSILHLDSDMIITGDLWKFWDHLSQFNEHEIMAATRGFEANDTRYLSAYRKWFGDIPHPPPRGVNGGLLLMNLTRMREYGWTEKFLHVYDDYSTRVTYLTGQRTVNILLGTHPGISKVLSCQYNFFHRHCDKGWTCEEAIDKKDGGIHLIHGNGFQLDPRGSFHEIYKGYRKFNMAVLLEHAKNYTGLVAAVRNQLMAPIRKAYGALCPMSRCYGTLNHILFREFFSDSSDFTIMGT